MRFEWTAFGKLLLTAVSSLFAAVLVPSVVWSFWYFRSSMNQPATGLAFVEGGLLERALSPEFWLIFILLLFVFHLTGTLDSRALRVTFFWIPTSVICVGGFALWGLFLYVSSHSPYVFSRVP
jgi:hypothetical protein